MSTTIKEFLLALVRKTRPEPGHEERLIVASVISGSAVSNFQVAASDLEDAANQLDILVTDIDAEIERLVDIRVNAESDMTMNRQIARQLRALIGMDEDLTLF